MSARCMDCSKFSVKSASEEWQRRGYGCCAKREKFIVFSAAKCRECGHFEEADTEVIRRRSAWHKTTRQEN